MADYKTLVENLTAECKNSVFKVEGDKNTFGTDELLNQAKTIANHAAGMKKSLEKITDVIGKNFMKEFVETWAKNADVKKLFADAVVDAHKKTEKKKKDEDKTSSKKKEAKPDVAFQSALFKNMPKFKSSPGYEGKIGQLLKAIDRGNKYAHDTNNTIRYLTHEATHAGTLYTKDVELHKLFEKFLSRMDRLASSGVGGGGGGGGDPWERFEASGKKRRNVSRGPEGESFDPEMAMRSSEAKSGESPWEYFKEAVQGITMNNKMILGWNEHKANLVSLGLEKVLREQEDFAKKVITSKQIADYTRVIGKQWDLRRGERMMMESSANKVAKLFEFAKPYIIQNLAKGKAARGEELSEYEKYTLTLEFDSRQLAAFRKAEAGIEKATVNMVKFGGVLNKALNVRVIGEEISYVIKSLIAPLEAAADKVLKVTGLPSFSENFNIENLIKPNIELYNTSRQMLFTQQGVTASNEQYMKQMQQELSFADSIAKTGKQDFELQREAFKSMRSGLRDRRTAAKLTEQSAFASHMLEASFENTAQLFRDLNLKLGLTTTQTARFARDMQDVGRATGLIGDELVDAVKQSEDLMKNMRDFGNYSSEAGRSLMGMMASAKKMGVDDAARTMLEALTNPTKLFEDQHSNVHMMAVNSLDPRTRQMVMDHLFGGTITQNPQALRALIQGYRNSMGGVTGGLTPEQVRQLPEQQRFGVENAFQRAFGMPMAKFERMLDALDEGTKTVEERMTDIRRRMVNADDETKRLLETQLRQLQSQQRMNTLSSIAEAAEEQQRRGGGRVSMAAVLASKNMNLVQAEQVLTQQIQQLNSEIEEVNRRRAERGISSRIEGLDVTTLLQGAFNSPETIKKLMETLSEKFQQVQVAQRAGANPMEEAAQEFLKIVQDIRQFFNKFIMGLSPEILSLIANVAIWTSVIAGAAGILAGLVKGFSALYSTILPLLSGTGLAAFAEGVAIVAGALAAAWVAIKMLISGVSDAISWFTEGWQEARKYWGENWTGVFMGIAWGIVKGVAGLVVGLVKGFFQGLADIFNFLSDSLWWLLSKVGLVSAMPENGRATTAATATHRDARRDERNWDQQLRDNDVQTELLGDINNGIRNLNRTQQQQQQQRPLPTQNYANISRDRHQWQTLATQLNDQQREVANLEQQLNAANGRAPAAYAERLSQVQIGNARFGSQATWMANPQIEAQLQRFREFSRSGNAPQGFAAALQAFEAIRNRVLGGETVDQRELAGAMGRLRTLADTPNGSSNWLGEWGGAYGQPLINPDDMNRRNAFQNATTAMQQAAGAVGEQPMGQSPEIIRLQQQLAAARQRAGATQAQMTAIQDNSRAGMRATVGEMLSRSMGGSIDRGSAEVLGRALRTIGIDPSTVLNAQGQLDENRARNLLMSSGNFEQAVNGAVAAILTERVGAVLNGMSDADVSQMFRNMTAGAPIDRGVRFPTIVSRDFLAGRAADRISPLDQMLGTMQNVPTRGSLAATFGQGVTGQTSNRELPILVNVRAMEQFISILTDPAIVTNLRQAREEYEGFNQTVARFNAMGPAIQRYQARYAGRGIEDRARMMAATMTPADVRNALGDADLINNIINAGFREEFLNALLGSTRITMGHNYETNRPRITLRDAQGGSRSFDHTGTPEELGLLSDLANRGGPDMLTRVRAAQIRASQGLNLSGPLSTAGNIGQNYIQSFMNHIRSTGQTFAGLPANPSIMDLMMNPAAFGAFVQYIQGQAAQGRTTLGGFGSMTPQQQDALLQQYGPLSLGRGGSLPPLRPGSLTPDMTDALERSGITPRGQNLQQQMAEQAINPGSIYTHDTHVEAILESLFDSISEIEISVKDSVIPSLNEIVQLGNATRDPEGVHTVESIEDVVETVEDGNTTLNEMRDLMKKLVDIFSGHAALTAGSETEGAAPPSNDRAQPVSKYYYWSKGSLGLDSRLGITQSTV